MCKANEIIGRRILQLWTTYISHLFPKPFEQVIFWLRFGRWMKETRFIIDRINFEDNLIKQVMGDEYPDDDDPRWVEYDKAMKKFELEYKKDWEKEDQQFLKKLTKA